MPRPSPAGLVRSSAQVVLGVFLLAAGIAHLTALRTQFRAQVPSWVPLDVDLVVVSSGVVEVVVGAALLLTVLPGPTPSTPRPPRTAGTERTPPPRVGAGLVAAALLVAVFPGNVAQYVEGTDAFGLDTDRARLVRLFFQPVLVAWALWCTGAAGWLLGPARGRR